MTVWTWYWGLATVDTWCSGISQWQASTSISRLHTSTNTPPRKKLNIRNISSDFRTVFFYKSGKNELRLTFYRFGIYPEIYLPPYQTTILRIEYKKVIDSHTLHVNND